jgi:cell division protein FtsB
MFARVPKEDQKRASRRRAPKAKTPARQSKFVWLLFFVASLIVVDGLVGERGLLAMFRARHQYDELSATIARQRSENARLRDEARRLKDDPAAIEEIARRELGLIRRGEKVFILKDVPPPASRR